MYVELYRDRPSIIILRRLFLVSQLRLLTNCSQIFSKMRHCLAAYILWHTIANWRVVVVATVTLTASANPGGNTSPSTTATVTLYQNAHRDFVGTLANFASPTSGCVIVSESAQSTTTLFDTITLNGATHACEDEIQLQRIVC